MLVGMVFGRLGGVMGRMKPVPLSDMGVVRRFLMVAGVMVLGSFEMMSCCVFVVFCRHLVVLGTFVFRHDVSSVMDLREAKRGECPVPAKLWLGV